MPTFIELIDRLIYGTGAEAIITPNHRDWGGGGGTGWITHHIDLTNPNSMLSAFESWRASNHLPPLIPWDGANFSQWDQTDPITSAMGISLGSDLDGSFSGIGNLGALGNALQNRYNAISNTFAVGFDDELKAPYQHRWWSFMMWANVLLRRFHGEVVVPPGIIWDRDGTILSATPFLDTVNEVHWRWHDNSGPHGLPFLNAGSPAGTTLTPGYSSTVGQRVTAIHAFDNNQIGEEFFRFHRDHVTMFNQWLARLGQPPAIAINMHDGWPTDSTLNPSAWTQPVTSPWINVEGGDATGNLRAIDELNMMGHSIMQAHADGHNNNADIVDARNNNYNPRFFAWHMWVDNQWFFREARFSRWDAATGQRDRVFRPVRNDGSNWPGMQALTIVRDPAAAADSVSPSNAVSGIDLTTGSGTLHMKLYVKNPYDGTVTLALRADVFDDAVSTTAPVETHSGGPLTFVVGAGGTQALETEFTVDIPFMGAFRSSDPPRTPGQPVGFVHSRIRVTGTLTPSAAADANFVHTDFTDIILVQERQAPQVDLYLNLSTFSDDQVQAQAGGGATATFDDALIVIVQDRTSRPDTIPWPATMADEVKGLLQGQTPAAGLFDDAAHAPNVVLLHPAGDDTPYASVTFTPMGAPAKEDPTLPDNLPQRYTYHYRAVIQAANDLFNGLDAMTPPRVARLQVTAADRAANVATESANVTLIHGGNPYMTDGDPAWLSIDTRVFQRPDNGNFGGIGLGGGPLPFIQQVVAGLNNGTIAASEFTNLPQDEDSSALEFSNAVTDHVAGTTHNVFNFALAKVHLQGAGGASNVRAFFRLFRYSATNLIFDPSLCYPTNPITGGGAVDKIATPGYTAAGDAMSIPFFAEARTPATNAQHDALNVFTFPGSAAEQVHYFGVWLDINQDNARLPSTKQSPEFGPFSAGALHPIRDLIYDAHCCMVVELNTDSDSTPVNATPASSDNLAQRNLAIVKTDNPGATITHTVQHSFEAETHRVFEKAPPIRTLNLITSADRERLIRQDAAGHLGNIRRQIIGERFLRTRELPSRQDLQRLDEELLAKYSEEAARRVDAAHPFIFDPVKWQSTIHGIDELLFIWRDLPRTSRVELFLPHVGCENVINLRNLRHAPRDVRILDSENLQLFPNGGVTYVPLPPSPQGRVNGIVTVELPDGIKRGQRWKVDVLQLRGAERRVTGAFQLDIQVSKAELIVDAEIRLLDILQRRLSHMRPNDRWRPILQRRLANVRARAKALAERAGTKFIDPTVWKDDRGNEQPVRGSRIRVVLEGVAADQPGRYALASRVITDDNGGISQKWTPEKDGLIEIAKPNEPARMERVIFDGYAEDDLEIEILLARKDKQTGTYCPYRRSFACDPDHWLGQYGPGGEAFDFENLGSWKVWYRIERN